MEQTVASSKAGNGNREAGGSAWRPILAAVFSFLASVWQTIRASFWSVQNKLSTDIAKPLDIERISRHIGVVKRAEAEGSQNLPPSSEEVPTGTQHEIIAYFTSLRRRARQQAAETAEKSKKALEQIHISDSLAKVRDIPANCENKILRYVADCESQLTHAVEREQKQRQHYDAFREINSLNRVASYPSAAYLYYLAVPVLVVALAVALASMVRANAGGTSGSSLTWVITVSAAAVIVPFVLGDLLPRSINHVSAFKRFIARIGTIVAIAAIIGMAFYTDFHIAAVLANPDTSYLEVLGTIRAAPLAVVSGIASWKGFGLVALTGLFAMMLAYRADDPYPGYGAVQRSYYRARDARDDAFSRLRKRINTLVDEAESQITATSKGFKDKVRTYTRLVEISEEYPSKLNDYDAELEDACNMVLDRYRVANTSARQSESPMSFAEHVCFNPAGDADSRLHSSGASQVTALQTAIADLEKESELARQSLRTLNLRMINSISEPHSEDSEPAE